MLVPHLLKIYSGLGWPLSVLEIVSVTKIKNKHKYWKKWTFNFIPYNITVWSLNINLAISAFYAEMNSELNEKDALGPKRLISTNVWSTLEV